MNIASLLHELNEPNLHFHDNIRPTSANENTLILTMRIRKNKGNFFMANRAKKIHIASAHNGFNLTTKSTTSRILAHQIFDKLTRPNKINKKGFFESENTVETTT